MSWIRTHEALGKLKELVLKGRYSYTFDGIPLHADHLSFKKRMNLLYAGIDMALGRSRCLALPPVMMVEPTNLCNLKCPLCPTGTGTLPRPGGMMSSETFQAVLDKLGDTLVSIYFFSFGEPFLNRELPRMIAASTKRNILSLVSTNGHFIQTMEEAEALVDSGLKVLIIALDGSTQDVYQAYRKNGDIEKVKRCADLIREAKSRRGVSYPYTVIRTVATRANEKDLPNIERLAAELGADMFSCKSVGCMVGAEDYHQFLPEDARMRRFSDADAPPQVGWKERCPFPFRQPVVFWDGSIAGCEFDHDLSMTYGHVMDENIRDAWNGAIARQLRRSILADTHHADFCLQRCPYRRRQKDSVNIYCRELSPLKDLAR